MNHTRVHRQPLPDRSAPPLRLQRAVVLALVLAIATGHAAAAVPPPSVRPPPVTLAGGGVTESAAAAAAQSSTGGKVVGIRRSGDTYEVTVLLANGQVRVVRVDAASGRVVGG